MTTPPADQHPQRTALLGRISRWVIILVTAGIIMYDAAPTLNPGRNDTISETMRNWARAAWSLPFYWGALTSHLFVNVGQHPQYKTLFAITGGVFLVLAAGNVLVHYWFHWTAPMGFRAGMLGVGFLFGLLLWSQDA